MFQNRYTVSPLTLQCVINYETTVLSRSWIHICLCYDFAILTNFLVASLGECLIYLSSGKREMFLQFVKWPARALQVRLRHQHALVLY